MHEVGIIQSTLELAERSARASGATQIHRLRLRVGRMTGVVRESLEFVSASVVDAQPSSAPSQHWLSRHDFGKDNHFIAELNELL